MHACGSDRAAVQKFMINIPAPLPEYRGIAVSRLSQLCALKSSHLR
jgi:hypothetical protein